MIDNEFLSILKCNHAKLLYEMYKIEFEFSNLLKKYKSLYILSITKYNEISNQYSQLDLRANNIDEKLADLYLKMQKEENNVTLYMNIYSKLLFLSHCNVYSLYEFTYDQNNGSKYNFRLKECDLLCNLRSDIFNLTGKDINIKNKILLDTYNINYSYEDEDEDDENDEDNKDEDENEDIIEDGVIYFEDRENIQILSHNTNKNYIKINDYILVLIAVENIETGKDDIYDVVMKIVDRDLEAGTVIGSVEYVINLTDNTDTETEDEYGQRFEIRCDEIFCIL